LTRRGAVLRMIRRREIRFADKIMRRLKFARDRTQNRFPLLLIAR
jgi:hypothetical protein